MDRSPEEYSQCYIPNDSGINSRYHSNLQADDFGQMAVDVSWGCLKVVGTIVGFFFGVALLLSPFIK